MNMKVKTILLTNKEVPPAGAIPYGTAILRLNDEEHRAFKRLGYSVSTRGYYHNLHLNNFLIQEVA